MNEPTLIIAGLGRCTDCHALVAPRWRYEDGREQCGSCKAAPEYQLMGETVVAATVEMHPVGDEMRITARLDLNLLDENAARDLIEDLWGGNVMESRTGWEYADGILTSTTRIARRATGRPFAPEKGRSYNRGSNRAPRRGR